MSAKNDGKTGSRIAKEAELYHETRTSAEMFMDSAQKSNQNIDDSSRSQQTVSKSWPINTSIKTVPLELSSVALPVLLPQEQIAVFERMAEALEHIQSSMEREEKRRRGF